MARTKDIRIHGLDAVRGGALLLRVVFHAAFSFFPGDQVWIVVDSARSETVSGPAFVVHIFRMTIFFMLAGYFARMQTYRLGTLKFTTDRLKRIGAPLLIFWVPMMVCFTALAIWSLVKANGGTMPENPPPPPPLTWQTFPLTHLWFLYVLLLFYGIALSFTTVLSWLGLKDAIGRAADAALRPVSKIGLLPILLSAPVALAFVLESAWHPFFGIPSPDQGFIPNRIAMVSYGIAFSVGWVMQRDLDHLRYATRPWPMFLIAAILATGYCLTAVGLEVRYVQPLPKFASIAYPIFYAFAVWFWTFGLIGLGLKVWGRESKIRRYIADSSYWLYIIHLPIVMALQIWMSDWAWSAELKFVAILAISIPLMLLSYEFFVRYTFVGALLNGRKRRRVSAPENEVTNAQ
ncbi:MAG: acyltransferase family protein [Pseudomonadota bacterium]